MFRVESSNYTIEKLETDLVKGHTDLRSSKSSLWNLHLFTQGHPNVKMGPLRFLLVSMTSLRFQLEICTAKVKKRGIRVGSNDREDLYKALQAIISLPPGSVASSTESHMKKITIQQIDSEPLFWTPERTLYFSS